MITTTTTATISTQSNHSATRAKLAQHLHLLTVNANTLV